MIDKGLPFRVTYDDVLFGWDEVLEDFRAFTKKDRHRVREGRGE
ncbi:hypothetical protein [Gordonia sp. ABSL49_1]|nr:hypothetical protein [Gordonia sp. ABSL49_1]